MAIPESQLTTWSSQGATQGSKDTYATIKGVLEDANAPYASRSYASFLQGSYGNDTNVYGVDSDVDVVLRCDSMFYYDLSSMAEAEQVSFKNIHGTAEYHYRDFKKDVTDWLTKKFPNFVDLGDKAIRIKASNNRRDADVLPCAQFRRYLKFNGTNDASYVEGISFFMPDGTQIINYPKQHSANMTTKHQATNNRLKPMVRIVKNMRNRMVTDGMLAAGIAPSYYLEGLLYNAPTALFETSYASTFSNCINHIHQADRSKFVCANEQYYLLHPSSPVTWRAERCDAFLTAIIKLWNEW